MTVHYGPVLLSEYANKNTISTKINEFFSNILSIFGVIVTTSSTIAKFSVNLFIIAVLVFLMFVLITESLKDEQIILSEIMVPKYIEERYGYNGSIITSDINDELQNITRNINTSKKQLEFLLPGNDLSFEIPQVGISVESLVQILRRIFGFRNRTISGQITCSPATSIMNKHNNKNGTYIRL